MATCGAIPYYERYFRDYAMLHLSGRRRVRRVPRLASVSNPAT